MINVPQSHVNYVANFTIPCKLSSHQTLYVKRINMCMDNRSELWQTIVYFLQMKRYLRLLKKSAVCYLRDPM